ncbi:hypothetical protein U1Q18_052820 [Sarracenia purpurea var. burkii]
MQRAPLRLGLRGMAAYAPSRVVRQYGLIQAVPIVEDMSSWFFNYAANDSKNRVKEGLRLWKLRQREKIPRGEGLGNVSTHRASRDYYLWIEANFGKSLPLTETEVVPPPNPAYRDFLVEYRLRHQKIQGIRLVERDSMAKRQHELEEENQWLSGALQICESHLQSCEGKLSGLVEVVREVRQEAIELTSAQNFSLTGGTEQYHERDFLDRFCKRFRWV